MVLAWVHIGGLFWFYWFFHSSKRVRLSSIDPNSDLYDEIHVNRYLGARRYLGIPDKLITNLKVDKVLTDLKQ